MSDTGVKVRKKISIKKPSLYKVILLNDDETPMDFVLYILSNIFEKDDEESMRIMLNTHKNGKEIVGIYTLDIALTKTNITRNLAKKMGYPLQLSIEEEVEK